MSPQQTESICKTIMVCTVLVCLGIACLATHSADPLLLLLFLVWFL